MTRFIVQHMFLVNLLQQTSSSNIQEMKQTLALLLLIISGVTFAQEEAPTTLTCPRAEQFEELLKENSGTWCSAGRFAEGANELFKLETSEYLNGALSSALHDNTHNANWIISKSTQDIREHSFCLELACDKIWETCSGAKNYNTEKEQDIWCHSRAEKFSKLEQLKGAQVAIENAKRKSRSNQREKMRAIEVRASQYFIPLLDQFHNAYRRFTQKIPTFIANPL